MGYASNRPGWVKTTIIESYIKHCKLKLKESAAYTERNTLKKRE